MPKIKRFYGAPLYCALSGFVKAKSNWNMGSDQINWS
jgi:hypothetical protein